MTKSINRRRFSVGLAVSALAGAAGAQGLIIFRSSDGIEVSGQTFGSGLHGVVLVPGAHGVGETWHFQALRLARAGFRVLAMDYRGYGRRKSTPNDENAHLDVLGAIEHLRASGAERISVIGASLGGRAAGMAAISAPGVIDRLVLLAHSDIDCPEKLGGRKLFIVASGDRDGSGRLRLESVRKQYERVPAPKELVVIDGAAHAQFLFLTPHGERLYAEILRFLSAD